MIIYSKSSGLNNPNIGKLETPLKMIIEHESDLLAKKGGICDSLFNVEKSNKFGETIVGQSDFDVFQAVEEGAGAPNDSLYSTYKKFFEHIQFMKEFTITAEMMEDANYGVAADAKRRAENFTRSYYRTRHKICSLALANGTKRSFMWNQSTVDTSTYDGLPLFHKAHEFQTDKMKGKTQSNRFCYENMTTDAAAFEEMLGELAVRMRNLKDENGEICGFTADTIILPNNYSKLERLAKIVAGTERAAGSDKNDINIQFGNWNVVVIPDWTPKTPSIMVMSSEANKALAGNMFFNRIPLTITNWVDHHTGNYIWNGRCRFGVGFGTYKHIMLCEEGAAVDGCEVLTIT